METDDEGVLFARDEFGRGVDGVGLFRVVDGGEEGEDLGSGGVGESEAGEHGWGGNFPGHAIRYTMQATEVPKPWTLQN